MQVVLRCARRPYWGPGIVQDMANLVWPRLGGPGGFTHNCNKKNLHTLCHPVDLRKLLKSHFSLNMTFKFLLSPELQKVGLC